MGRFGNILVRGHQRNGRYVRAYSRGSRRLMLKPESLPISVSNLRGKNFKVTKTSTVNFASGPQKYVTVSYKKRGYRGRIKRETAEVPVRFLKTRRGGTRF